MSKLSAAGARVKAALMGMGIELMDDDCETIARAATAKPSKDPTALQEMAEAIIALCQWPKAKWGRATTNAKKILAEGKTVAEIKLHYGPTDPGPGVWWWWRDGDFRKKDGLWAEWIVESLEKWNAPPLPSVAGDVRLEGKEYKDVALQKRKGALAGGWAYDKARAGAAAGAGASPRRVMLDIPESRGEDADAGWG